MQVSPLIYTKNVHMFNCAKHNNELNAHYLNQPITYTLLQDSSDTHKCGNTYWTNYKYCLWL